MTTPSNRVALAVLAFAALGTPAAAQHLSLTPQIGFYIPTRNLPELATGGEFTEIEAGPSFGGRLGLWFGSRFGIEATGAYIPTTYKLTQGSSNPTSQDA